jgi:zinc protease
VLVRLAPVDQFTLSNGLRVILQSDPQLPVWRGWVMAGAGTSADHADQPGLSSLTAQAVMRTGTARYTPADVERTVIHAGVAVSGANRFRHSVISFAGPAATAAPVLEMIREAVMSPLFRRRILEAGQSRLEQARSGPVSSMRAAADRQFFAAFENPGQFSGEQGGKRPLLVTEDLADFYRHWWDPSNVVLVLCGDFEPAAMATKIRADWAGWASQGKPARSAANRKGQESPQVVLYSPENTPQSAVSIGQWLENLNPREEAAVQIFARILESQFTGSVRGVSSGAVGDAGRPFQVFADVAVRETVDAVKQLTRSIDEARNSPVAAADLAQAKRSVLERFATRFDRPWKSAEFIGELLVTGRSAEFVQEFQQAVRSMTAPELSKLIKTLLPPEKNVVSIAGDERDFRDPVATLKLPVRKVSGRPGAGIQEAVPRADSQEKGIRHLAKMREAMGGLAAIEGIRDGEWSYKVSVLAGNSPLTLDQRVRWLRSGAIRHDEKAGIAESVIYYDGKTGWRWRRQVKEALTPDVARQFAGELFRTPYVIALADRDEGRSVSYLGSSIIRIQGEGNQSVDVALDEVTGLPEAYRYANLGRNGALVPVEEKHSDYRKVEDVMVAGRIEILEAGRLLAVFELASIRFNAGMTPEQLQAVP